MRSDNMPQKKDLLERLNDWAGYVGGPEDSELCGLAAEEIERLRGELAYCRTEMKAVWDHVKRVSPWSESNDMNWSDEVGTGIHFLVQERDDARRSANYWKAEHLAGNVELSALRAKIEEAPVRIVEEHHIDGRFFEYLRLEWPLGAGPLPSIIGKRVRLVVCDE